MKLGSVVEMSGRTGNHTALNGQPCPGRLFSVVSVGVGGVHQNQVECETCHMRLAAYANEVVDPFAAAVRDTASTPLPGTFKVSTDYRFRLNGGNHLRSDPEIWFRSEQDARAIFDNLTQDAALAVWRPGNQEILDTVTVSLSVREGRVWKQISDKKFSVVLATVSR